MLRRHRLETTVARAAALGVHPRTTSRSLRRRGLSCSGSLRQSRTLFLDGPSVLFMRVAVGVGAVLVALLAVLVGRRGVLLRLLVLAVLVMVGRLEMVMGGGMVPGGGL